MQILTEPNPILRKQAKEIDPKEITTPDFQALLADMIKTMYASKGIGLAGPQVGISRRVIIAERAKGEAAAFVNPEIIGRSWKKVRSEEGCLSIPGKWGIVLRHAWVKVRTYDKEGKLSEFRADGLFGIILQHEIDHLNGILFIDKAEEVHELKEDRAPAI